MDPKTIETPGSTISYMVLQLLLLRRQGGRPRKCTEGAKQFARIAILFKSESVSDWKTGFKALCRPRANDVGKTIYIREDKAKTKRIHVRKAHFCTFDVQQPCRLQVISLHVYFYYNTAAENEFKVCMCLCLYMLNGRQAILLKKRVVSTTFEWTICCREFYDPRSF